MKKESAIKIFEQKQIRTHWDDEQEKWYFSIVDVVGVLSESIDPQSYWRKLKQRLKRRKRNRDELSRFENDCS